MTEAGDGGGLAGIARKNRLLEYPTCVDCLFHSRKLLDSETLRRIALKTRNRTELFVESFIATRENLNGRRAQLNEKYLKLIPYIEPLLGEPRNILALSALGNSLDHNMRWWGDEGVELDTSLAKMLNTAVIDPEAIGMLVSSEKIAILLDNSGEAVIDIAVGIILARWGKEVGFIARDEVYEIDVDYNTVIHLFKKVSSLMRIENPGQRIRFFSTGGIYPAPASPNLPRETRRYLEEADLIISKGIANAEALLDKCYPLPKKTLVVLTAKCPPIARLFNVTLGTPLARLGYPCGLNTKTVG